MTTLSTHRLATMSGLDRLVKQTAGQSQLSCQTIRGTIKVAHQTIRKQSSRSYRQPDHRPVSQHCYRPTIHRVVNQRAGQPTTATTILSTARLKRAEIRVRGVGIGGTGGCCCCVPDIEVSALILPFRLWHPTAITTHVRGHGRYPVLLLTPPRYPPLLATF